MNISMVKDAINKDDIDGEEKKENSRSPSNFPDK
jgi:hypothetical protein